MHCQENHHPTPAVHWKVEVCKNAIYFFTVTDKIYAISEPETRYAKLRSFEKTKIQRLKSFKV